MFCIFKKIDILNLKFHSDKVFNNLILNHSLFYLILAQKEGGEFEGLEGSGDGTEGKYIHFYLFLSAQNFDLSNDIIFLGIIQFSLEFALYATILGCFCEFQNFHISLNDYFSKHCISVVQSSS